MQYKIFTSWLHIMNKLIPHHNNYLLSAVAYFLRVQFVFKYLYLVNWSTAININTTLLVSGVLVV